MKSIKRIAPLFIAVVLLVAACNKTVQTAAISSDAKLKYNFEENKEYKYLNTTVMEQLMTFMGQEIAVDVESSMAYSIFGAGKTDDKISIKVRLDSIQSSANSMQGQMESDPKEIRGKEFTMTLSELGKESDLEEAEKIEYIAVGDQPTNMKATFSILFTDLPEAAAKIGYTWTQSDTIDLSAGEQSAQMIIHSNNIIETKETYNGYECYKISSTNTGERTSSGNTPQGFISTSGKLTGSGIVYFAIKEGVVIKEDLKQKFDGEVSIPTGESIPMYMNIKMTNELLK